MIVISIDENDSDSKAVEMYNKIFLDEGHILVVLPTAWYSLTTYYVMGNITNTVILRIKL